MNTIYVAMEGPKPGNWVVCVFRCSRPARKSKRVELGKTKTERNITRLIACRLAAMEF